MSLVDYTDKAIMKIILDQALQMNPWLKVGEKLDTSYSVVSNGKVMRDVDLVAPTNLITNVKLPANIQAQLPNVPVKQTIQTRTVSLRMSDVAEFRTAGLNRLDFKLTRPTYIHTYSTELLGRQWLEEYNIGDMVSVGIPNPTNFEIVYTEIPLTQQMIDDAEIIFRFALSDQ